MNSWRHHPALVRCLPFGLFLGLLVIGPYLPVSWAVISRTVLVGAVLIWCWPTYVDLRQPPSTSTLHWLLALAAGFAIFGIWIFLDHDWVMFSRSGGFDPRARDGTLDWPITLTRLLGLVVVVPLMEELFWRSFLLRWLERHDFVTVAPRQVGTRAFLITTVLFAIEHNQWLAGAIAGATYSWLYIRSGNLWVPVVAHAVTNGALGIWILYTRNWQFW